jgi:hypothetical protein
VLYIYDPSVRRSTRWLSIYTSCSPGSVVSLLIIWRMVFLSQKNNRWIYKSRLIICKLLGFRLQHCLVVWYQLIWYITSLSYILTNAYLVILKQDMWLYLTEKDNFNDFNNEDALYWHETNIPYGVWGPTSTQKRTLTYYPSEVLSSVTSFFFFLLKTKTFCIVSMQMMRWIVFLKYYNVHVSKSGHKFGSYV